jgi:ABC-type molybdate transport system permease subunit
MEARLLAWLQSVGWTAFWISVTLFVVINGLGLAMLLARRDRALVNSWTSRFLAANLVLVGTGLGIPLLTSISRLAVSVSAPVLRSALSPLATQDAAAAPSLPE